MCVCVLCVCVCVGGGYGIKEILQKIFRLCIIFYAFDNVCVCVYRQRLIQKMFIQYILYLPVYCVYFALWL